MVYLISTGICFLVNLLLGNQFTFSVLNSIILLTSLLIFQRFNKKKKVSLLIILISLVPIFLYQPINILVPLCLLLSLILLFLADKYNNFFLISSLLFFSLSSLLSNGILTSKSDLNFQRLIWNRELIEHKIITHQRDAMYLPYPIRRAVYNRGIYIYQGLADFFKLISLKNLADLILLANLYPLAIGVKQIWKKNKKHLKYLSHFLGLTILITGLSRYIDKFHSLYSFGPFLIYLIMLGVNKVNKKIYFGLMGLSLFLTFYA